MHAQKPVAVVALALTVVGMVLVGALWAFQRRIIYQPDTAAPPPAAQVIVGAHDVTLHTADGIELEAWLVPASPISDRGAAVLYAPGNGGNRAGRAGIAQLLADRGFTVLLLDYRGFGGNPGSPTEEGTTFDLLAGMDLLEQAGFTPENVVYFGESLGGGVVANAQRHVPPAGIVLRSPFTELADVAAEMLPWLPVGWLLREDYPLLEQLSTSEIPTTVIYGDADTMVPGRLSKQVAAALPNLFEEVELAGGHNDPVMFGPPVADAVVRLVEHLRS